MSDEPWEKYLYIGHKRDWTLGWTIQKWGEANEIADSCFEDIRGLHMAPIAGEYVVGKMSLSAWFAETYPRTSRWLLKAWAIRKLPAAEIVDGLKQSGEQPFDGKRGNRKYAQEASNAVIYGRNRAKGQKIARNIEKNASRRSRQWYTTK